MIKNKKIAINLVGISHLDSKVGQPDAKGMGHHNRFYPDHPPNIIENIINPLKKHNDVFVHLTTYSHQKQQELISMYDPENYNIIENFRDSYMQGTYIKSLENLIDEEIDIVFSCRFDIVFKKTIEDMNVDENKFNAIFREKGWAHKNYTSDIFFIFPKLMISDIIESINALYSYDTNGLHGLAHQLSKKISYDNINIMDEEDELGNNTKYFYIPRLHF
jgi:hypothetical protein